jgi:hypothetical protein
MATKTGWKAVFSIKKYQKPNSNNEEQLIPKSVLVRYGVWEETVEGNMRSGCSEAVIREAFKEYGCSEEEIDGYFEQYWEDVPLLANAAHA